MVLSLFVVNTIVPELQQRKEEKDRLYKLTRFKNNRQIFESLLSLQNQMPPIPDGLGITLGNPNGSVRIVKVCNPFCKPCSQSHPHIEQLLETNEDVQLNIIFTATEKESDSLRLAPAKHFMAVRQRGDVKVTQQMLKAWYIDEEKDYVGFSKKYPVEQADLDAQFGTIEEMKIWCKSAKIRYTPTFFINGRQLPSMYKIADLKHLIL